MVIICAIYSTFQNSNLLSGAPTFWACNYETYVDFCHHFTEHPSSGLCLLWKRVLIVKDEEKVCAELVNCFIESISRYLLYRAIL